MPTSLTQVVVRATHGREDEGLGAAQVGQHVCMSQVVTGTHRSKGTERSSVLTDGRGRARKGGLEQGYSFYFTPVDSKQLLSNIRGWDLCCSGPALSPAALLEQRPVVIVDGLSTSSHHR